MRVEGRGEAASFPGPGRRLSLPTLDPRRNSRLYPGALMRHRRAACSRLATLSDERLTNMATGLVKWYNPTKGFGFIQPEGGGKDVFVHVSAVERAGHGDPQEGDRISYDLEKGRDGRESAINLRPAED